MERIYNKLVRDNIPNIIQLNGEMPVTRILEDDVYRMELEKKLNEEYYEVLEASGDDRIKKIKNEFVNTLIPQSYRGKSDYQINMKIAGKLADMLEIISALAKLENKTLQDVIDCSERKKEKRGAFEKKIFLEKVIEKE